MGNPINLASGNKFQRETDYRGKGEFPLVLERSYNSLLSHENSTLGAGWQHNYDRRISEQEDGLLRVVRADGRRHLFRRDGQHWFSTDGNVDRLIDHVRNEQHLGWHYFPGTGGEEHYDNEGRLQRLIHTHGQQQNLNYNEHGLLHSVTDAYGEQLRFHYQDAKLIRVDSPDGRQHHYQYDKTHGTLVSVSQRSDKWLARLGGSKHTRHYHYEDTRHAQHLTGITDESDRRYARWAYDAHGRAVVSEHGQGVERIELEYLNGKTRVTNAAGRVATYHLVDIHGIKRVSRIEGEVSNDCPDSRQQHLYADTGFVTTAIDAEGRARLMKRDRRGLILEEIRGARWKDGEAIIQPESLRITRQWHPELPLVVLETHYQRSAQQWQPQREERSEYGPRGRLLAHTVTNLSTQQQPYANQGASRSWRYQYAYHNAEQTLLKHVQVIDPRQHEQDEPLYSQIDYDKQGRLIQSRNVLGHSTSYSQHTAQGQPGRIIDPNALDTRLHYTAQGQLTRIQQRGEHTSEVSIHYLANGLPERLELADGQWLQVDYNDARQLIGLSNAQGERISITPNLVSSNWEQLSIADAEGQIALKQQRQLDELGRVVAQLGNAGQQTRIHYDKTGHAVRIDQHSSQSKQNNQNSSNNQANAGDPSGVLSTVQHYDSLGRLTQHIDPAQGETHLKHNSNGQIRQVTAANDARTTYIYDGLGQLLQEHSPDTGTRIHHYDTAGQRIRSHGLEQFDQPELSAQHHYDALGRLIHIQAPDSADDVRYHYDQTGTEDDRNHGIGRLTAIEDRHSRIEYRYDRHGNLLSDHRTLNIDGQSHTQHTRYSYTQGNQLASITYPNGQRIDYLYRQGQADSITLNENRQQKILVSDIQYRRSARFNSGVTVMA